VGLVSGNFLSLLGVKVPGLDHELLELEHVVVDVLIVLDELVFVSGAHELEVLGPQAFNGGLHAHLHVLYLVGGFDKRGKTHLEVADAGRLLYLHLGETLVGLDLPVKKGGEVLLELLAGLEPVEDVVPGDEVHKVSVDGVVEVERGLRLDLVPPLVEHSV